MKISPLRDVPVINGEVSHHGLETIEQAFNALSFTSGDLEIGDQSSDDHVFS